MTFGLVISNAGAPEPPPPPPLPPLPPPPPPALPPAPPPPPGLLSLVHAAMAHMPTTTNRSDLFERTVVLDWTDTERRMIDSSVCSCVDVCAIPVLVA